MSMAQFIFVATFMFGAAHAAALESTVLVAERKKAATLSAAENKDELQFYLGNESNADDGVFGTVTFGLFGEKHFENNFQLEGDYVRAREPGMTGAQNTLDDAYLALRGPVPQGPLLGVSVWRNHLMDMYTTVLGFEASPRAADWSFGLLFGSASRAGSMRNFRALELSATQEFLRYQFTESALFGNIGRGWYRSLGFSAGFDIESFKGLPMNVSIHFQDNSFAFGKDGPLSEPQHEFVIVGAIQFSLLKLF